MKNPIVRQVLAEAKKRLGVERSTSVQRFRHRQIDVWTRAFQLADRNGRIAVGLGVLLALSLTLNIVQQGRPANVIFVDQLGADNQSLPVLIIAGDRKLAGDAPLPQSAMGKKFFSSERAIRDYLATQYVLPRPS